MIHLMLYADGEQIVRFQLEGVAVAILRPDLDPLGARNQSTVAGHGEAALFDAGAAGLLQDLRVDQHQLFFAVLGDIDDDDALMNVDLGRGQADAFLRVHGFEHIIYNVL